MFWINLGLSLVGGLLAVSIGYLIVKKPREKLLAFIIVFGLCIITFTFLRIWIIKPVIIMWFDQKEINKRPAAVPSYNEVNKQDSKQPMIVFITDNMKRRPSITRRLWNLHPKVKQN